MGEFLKFIQKSKQALTCYELHKTIHLVLGNESCDLDSTVSALVLAYLLQTQKSNNNQLQEDVVIPVMNVEAKYFHLRTETCYLLKKFGIDWNNFVFRDQINYGNLLKTGKVQTSIVDHHVLSNHDKILEDSVVQIFDHRPINTEEICKSKKLQKTVIKTVGSCTTLITSEIMNTNILTFSEEVAQLLYATIIYDTIGLNKESGKTFDEDIEVAEYLEGILQIPKNRKELFDELWKIHNDTSNLTTKDLLYRDLKIVKGVPVPGLPMLVQEYLDREDADASITEFAKEYNSPVVIIIGIDASKQVKRDILIFSTDPKFRDIVINVFKSSGSQLSLKEIPIENQNITCFSQGNIKLTRKFIIPLVNEAVSRYNKNQ